MDNKEKKQNHNILTHSLTGNTSGNNSIETLVSILNETTVKPSAQATNSNTNQSKKVGE